VTPLPVLDSPTSHFNYSIPQGRQPTGSWQEEVGAHVEACLGPPSRQRAEKTQEVQTKQPLEANPARYATEKKWVLLARGFLRGEPQDTCTARRTQERRRTLHGSNSRSCYSMNYYHRHYARPTYQDAIRLSVHQVSTLRSPSVRLAPGDRR
jgi:hypothetical protein